MIKGINHQIIEVTQTENKYYERALLVLKPEYATASAELLETEAKKLLSNMDTISSLKQKSSITNRIVSACIYGGIGSLVTVFIYTLF